MTACNEPIWLGSHGLARCIRPQGHDAAHEAPLPASLTNSAAWTERVPKELGVSTAKVASPDLSAQKFKETG